MKLRDICQPFHIWLFCMEVTLYHVRDCRGYLSFIGIVLLALNIWNDKLFFLHEPTDHLLGHCDIFVFQRAMNSPVAVSAGGVIEHGTNLYTEIGIFIRSIKRCLLITVTALRHMKNIQQFLELILAAKGANHDCFFTIGQLFETDALIFF